MNTTKMTFVHNLISHGQTLVESGNKLRRGITAGIVTLVATIMILAPVPVSASDTPPNHIDLMDQAYLAEYEQRAVEKYEAMLAMQEKNKVVTNHVFSDWGGELFLAEYQQRAQEQYEAMLAMQEKEEQLETVAVSE